MKLFRQSIIEFRSHTVKIGLLFFVTFSSFASFSQDEDALSCSDGIDNDFDTLVDLEDDECILSDNPLCSDCPDGISFADELIAYSSGCGESDPNPEGALGVCDWNDTGADSPSHVYLGNDGFIRLRFNNNFLLNSGDNSPDLRIIQAGVDLEFHLSLRPFDEFTETALQNSGFVSANSDGFYEVQTLGLITSDLDIDSVLPAFAYGELRFDAVEVKDAGNGCMELIGVPGVRIDAVCAMTSMFYSPPFGCSESAYLFQGSFPEQGIYEVDLINQTSTLITDDVLSIISSFNPLTFINAYGYNPIDNKIWGVWGSQNSIVRINSNFRIDSMVVLPGLEDGSGYGAGDINNDGVYAVFSQSNDMYLNIDLNPSSSTYLTIISSYTLTESSPLDWAFSPVDGLLYSVTNDLRLVSNSLDGSFLDLGLTSIVDEDGDGQDIFNGAWMDGNGSLYVQSGDDGDIFRIDNPHLGMLEAEFLFTGPQAGLSDGARCNANIPYDCNQIVGGTAVFDECGICLELTDPAFNQSCSDCLGEINGTAILDDCGECLNPASPEFNQSCADCAGVPNGSSIIDDCGECLELTDPEFNQSCADCAGIPNGTAILDECGVCLQPDDPNFNLSCTDCAGVINGTAVIDDCGVCLNPNSPDFNQSCADCAGVPNGTSIIDECGECLELTDPEFNQSCADCLGIPNGTFILDECEECLEPNDPSFNLSCTDCAGVINGSSEIDQCGECLEPTSPEFNQSCADCAGVPNGLSVFDECGVCLLPDDALFNLSCTDCEGIINGSSLIDECGECLLPNDPNFNQSCADCAGVPNGQNLIDLCGECWPEASPFFNACVDCNGTVFGDWFLNVCNICTSPEEEDPDLVCFGDLVFIPNSFTPDTDGLNDVFKPTFYIQPDDYSFSIFNRYGELIFTSSDHDIGWNGSVRSGDYYAPNGVYSFVVTYKGFGSTEVNIRKGHVSLIR